MEFEDTYINKDHRFSLGKELNSGKYYLSIPVSNQMVDYEEYYEITSNGYESLIIHTDDDLSIYNGRNSELIGVHSFDTIDVQGGAQVDFGIDRVFVNDLGSSILDDISHINAGENSQLPISTITQ